MSLFRKPLPAPERHEPVACPAYEAPRRSWFSTLFRQYSADSATETAQERAFMKRYTPYVPPAGVRGESALACDSASDASMGALHHWAATNTPQLAGYLEDGLGFMGYPQLAHMAQRPEFRKPCDVYARECTREWITLRCQHGARADDARADKIRVLEQDVKSHDIRRLLHQHVLQSLLYGIAHLYVDIEGAPKNADGQSAPLMLTPEGFRKGSLRGFKSILPVWTTPNFYNATNPLQDEYYRPRDWWVQGCLVHRSRLKTTVPYPVDDLLKPAFNFGGLSLTQQLRTYVHNFLRTRNSVSDITANFSKLVLKTDLSSALQGGDMGQSSVMGRAAFMQQVAEGQSTIVADKENEDVSVVATPLGGLSELQAQAMEAMASIPGIPLVKLFGITPNGLNASSEGEIRVFYDEISSFQEAHLRPVLEWVMAILQLNRWGEIDPSITLDFAPLWQLDDEKAASVERTKTETDKMNIEMGKITPDEARQREAQEGKSFYRGVDLNSKDAGIPSSAPHT